MRRISWLIAVLVVLGLVVVGTRQLWIQADPLKAIKTSKYERLLQDGGFADAGELRVDQIQSVVHNGQEFEIVTYSTEGFLGIQILHREQWVTNADLAFDILLTNAWSRSDEIMPAEDVESLRVLRDQMRNTQSEYQTLFELTTSLEPIIKTIERLKDLPISGVPLIEIKGFPLLDITNAWDAICTVPVNAADLCLFEPLLQELYSQGVEIERLLDDSEHDLSVVIELLESRSAESPPDGLALKVATEKAFTSLRNLVLKIDDFNQKALTLQELNQRLIEIIENRSWSQIVTSTLNQARRLVPGFDPDQTGSDLVNDLRSLDERLSSTSARLDQLASEIMERVLALEDARALTDASVREMGRQWRTRPVAR